MAGDEGDRDSRRIVIDVCWFAKRTSGVSWTGVELSEGTGVRLQPQGVA